MRFVKGFTIGLLTGFAAGVAVNERQRREALERLTALARRRARSVDATVAGSASDVAAGVHTAVDADLSPDGPIVAR